jgi:hypothetical protein
MFEASTFKSSFERERSNQRVPMKISDDFYISSKFFMMLRVRKVNHIFETPWTFHLEIHQPKSIFVKFFIFFSACPASVRYSPNTLLSLLIDLNSQYIDDGSLWFGCNIENMITDPP